MTVDVAKCLEKIESRESIVGIVGMGYVGLPLAMAFADEGFTVLGFDTDRAKAEAIGAGRSYIRHLASDRIARLVQARRLFATDDFSRIKEVDAVLICVPTPLDRHRNPDLTYIEATARQIAPYLTAGTLVCLESTTYPGTTEEFLAPLLEQDSNMKRGTDFLLAYSPEREDPNNPDFTTSTIPKVIGASDEVSRKVAVALYGAVVERTVPVGSCDVAEAAKLLENIFRSVNIALVNEMKVVLDRMDIDVWEVIEAASTKPFGFMPFYPGPGLGGHCIPIDPFYLTWRAREFGLTSRFIELAGEINTFMPEYVVNKTIEGLNSEGKALRGSRILILGLAYKPNVDDLRESPSMDLIERYEKLGALVDYHDPYVPVIPPTRKHGALAGRKSVPFGDFENYDTVVVSTAHAAVDHRILLEADVLVVDTRNAVNPDAPAKARVVRA